jgi:hypothetical protein
MEVRGKEEREEEQRLEHSRLQDGRRLEGVPAALRLPRGFASCRRCARSRHSQAQPARALRTRVALCVAPARGGSIQCLTPALVR